MFDLALSQIQIWHININQENYSSSRDLQHLLSRREQENLNKFKFLKDQISYLVSYVVLRLLIAKYTGMEFDQIVFRYNNYGKPYIKGYDMYFNLSHTLSNTVIAFCKKEIGIDIEHLDREVEVDNLAQMVFSAREQGLLKRSQKDYQHKKFFEIWTQKEAALKCIGIGIGHELNEVDVGGLHQVKVELDKHNYLLRIDAFDIPDSNCIGHVAYQDLEQAAIQIHYWDYKKYT
jgi:4'-phosphopantetheinyl transferase